MYVEQNAVLTSRSLMTCISYQRTILQDNVAPHLLREHAIRRLWRQAGLHFVHQSPGDHHLAHESPIGILVRSEAEFVGVEQKDVQLTVGPDESPQEDTSVSDSDPERVIQEALNRR